MVFAVSSLIARPNSEGSNSCSGVKSGAVMASTRLGFITMPPLAIAAETIAICIGVARTSPWPNAVSAVCGSSSTRG